MFSEGELVDIRSIRFLVNFQGSLRAFFKVAISKNDASLYIFPYSINGQYYGGISILPQSEQGEYKQKVDVDYAEQLDAEVMPKLSIHESGQIHANIGGNRAGPFTISELQKIKNEHIATVSTENLVALPKYKKVVNPNPPKLDFIINLEGPIESIRTLIYVNGVEPKFSSESVILTLGTRGREHLSSPIYFGFKSIPQPDLRVERKGNPGILVISGWDVSRPIIYGTEFLFIRGE